MLAHILNAGIRALAASIILGGVLIYAAGGFDSPNIRPLGGVIVAGFFVFWMVFVFMFGERVPAYDRKRQDRDLDDNTPSRFAVGAAIPMVVGMAAKEVRASAVAAMATAVAIKPDG